MFMIRDIRERELKGEGEGWVIGWGFREVNDIRNGGG